MLILLIAVSYLIYNPSVLGIQEIEKEIEGFKAMVLSSDSATTQQILGLTDAAKDGVISFTQNTKLPSEVTGLPEEVVVEDYVDQMKEEVKKLPEKQLHEVKKQFCQDVIQEAFDEAGVQTETGE